MNLLEAFIRDEIFIDFGADVLYGSDQCNVSFPCRFPTVTFQLMATNGLSQIADRIRKDLGFAPMHTPTTPVITTAGTTSMWESTGIRKAIWTAALNSLW